MTDANDLPTLDFGPPDGSPVPTWHAAAGDALTPLYMVRDFGQYARPGSRFECEAYDPCRVYSMRACFPSQQEAIDAANAHYRANRRTP